MLQSGVFLKYLLQVYIISFKVWVNLYKTKSRTNSALVFLCLQVFATYPNEDYDRRNEDVDPMAASAEYELEKRVERLDLFPVELEKGTVFCSVV